MMLTHLKYITTVAKAGSVNKAAEILCVGQPNLSRAIKDFESKMGFEIFERSARGMTLTSKGAEFIIRAEHILNEIEEIETVYSDKARVQKFSLCVPRVSYICDAFSQFTTKLDPDHGMKLSYCETDTLHTVENVARGEYRLGIIRFEARYDEYYKEYLNEKGLQYELVNDFTPLLIMSKDNPLAKKAELNISDLSDYIEVDHAEPTSSLIQKQSGREEFEAPNVTRKIYVFERASQFEILRKNPSAFMWVSPVPKHHLEANGLIQRKCSGNTQRLKDFLIRKINCKLTKYDSMFITELTNAKRNVTSEI